MLVALMFAKRPTAPESSKSTLFEENPAYSCIKLLCKSSCSLEPRSSTRKQGFRVRGNMLPTVTIGIVLEVEYNVLNMPESEDLDFREGM